MSSVAVNPYQTPISDIRPPPKEATAETPLAERVTRLWAAIVDSIVLTAINFPLLTALGLLDFTRTTLPPFHEQLLSVAIGFALFASVQGYFLTRGQTVGKKLFGIRMVDFQTGEPPGVGKLLGLRYLPVSLAAMVPFVGSLLSLLDVLFIFREDRRCLHDLIADTKVVRASAPGTTGGQPVRTTEAHGSGSEE